MEISVIGEAIQLATAPVFLLTGVAGMLNVLGVRLARVVDRGRVLESALDEENASANAHKRDHQLQELQHLGWRMRVINSATAMLVLCAVLIGLTVIELFYSANELGRLKLSTWVSMTFIGGFAAFVTACVLYLVEILIASHTINFRVGKH
jgi:hypothetical protein